MQPVQPKGGRNPFAMASPGAAMNQAIQQAASNRGRSVGGDYGSFPVHAKADMLGGLEIMSDTKGVDFGPYLKRLQFTLQGRFDVEVPQVARPPVMKKGRVIIEFTILKDGTITAMKMLSSAGDASLDRGAWGTLTFGPVDQLPQNFTGDYLVLRGAFYYNPEKGDFE